MKYMLLVCSIALTLTLATLPQALGQSPALQQGVSVQMVSTTHAEPMPAADNPDAWVVAVTADGSLFLGADSMTPETLAGWMQTHPRHRDAKLYIKADARAPFGNVERVLKIGREVAFEAPVLLTSQPATPAYGTVMPPNGLEVLTGPGLPAGQVTTLVQVFSSGPARPSLKVNGDEIPWSALEGTLRQHFEKGDAKVILLKADPQLPFAQVANVIDTCRSQGAKVILSQP